MTPSEPTPAPEHARAPQGWGWWRWCVLGVAVAALVVVAWAAVTAWGAVVHGNPAYAVLLALTVPVESISGSQDGLSTPAKVDASRADLPADAGFTVIDGAVHAFFGDYGPQRGDGTPTITHDDARTQIIAATRTFVATVAPTP